MANESHGYEQYVYECSCGAWWVGDIYATGTGPQPGKTKQECPKCGDSVIPVAMPVD